MMPRSWSRRGKPAIERFPLLHSRGAMSFECWLWKGAQKGEGYASFWDGKRFVLAHRFSWETAHDRPIPEGLHIDHLCRIRHCVNPAHLEAVPLAENNARRNRAMKFFKEHAVPLRDADHKAAARVL